MSLAANNVMMTVDGAPGTGTVTLLAASANMRTFLAAYGAVSTTVDVRFQDGTAWEIARNCTYNGGSPGTVTRGTLETSSTGSALSLTSAATVEVVLPASAINSYENAIQTHIRGLIVTKNSGGNTLDISAGACFDPSSGRVISYDGTTALSAGTLGASQWNQVYIYDNAGTATIQVVNNANPPSTTYAGTARQGGTNSNRRWIGSFLTTSGSAIYAVNVEETAANQISVKYIASITGSPFRIISAGNKASYGAAPNPLSLIGAAPASVCSELLCVITVDGATNSDASLDFSLDGTNRSAVSVQYIKTAATSYPSATLWLPIIPATPAIYYSTLGSSQLVYMDIAGYKAAR